MLCLLIPIRVYIQEEFSNYIKNQHSQLSRHLSVAGRNSVVVLLVVEFVAYKFQTTKTVVL